MRKDIKELKARIGKRKFNEIKAFVNEQKEKGRSTEEIKTAIQEEFGKEIARTEDFIFIIPTPTQ